MTRIRNLWVPLLPLVALSKGDFAIYLDGDLPNLIGVSLRGNQSHPLTCSHFSISDIFPNDTVQHLETVESINTGSSAIHQTLLEPALITLYDSVHDQICEQKRGTISLSPNFYPGMRLIHLCYNCVDDTTIIQVDDTLISKQTSAKLGGAAEQNAYLEVQILSLHWPDEGRNTTSGSVSVSFDSETMNIASMLTTSDRRVLRTTSTTAVTRLPSFRDEATANALENSLTSIGSGGSTSGSVVQPRTMGREVCLLALDECCGDSHCPSNNLCIDRHCIDEGYPRFTLTWQGDDDIDLQVVTPAGFVLSYQHIVDPATGGKVGESVEQGAPGYHIENIHFPMDGTAPDGVYEYYVRPMTTVGTGDQWTVTVWDEQGEVTRHTGTRFSSRYRYLRGQDHSTSSIESISTSAPSLGPTIDPLPRPEPFPPSLDPMVVPPKRPTLAPPSHGPTVDPLRNPTLAPPSLEPMDDTSPVPDLFIETKISQSPTLTDSLPPHDNRISSRTTLPCTPFIDECCVDTDCLFNGEVCFNRNCVDDGSPRFTLSWIGDDDLDLIVLTPEGTELSFMNFFDPTSGGRFGEDFDQFGTGYHVENVFFPETGAPFGSYQFFVRPLTKIDEADEWSLTVFDGGRLRVNETGIGESSRFSYLREIFESEPSPSSPVPLVPPTSRPSSRPVLGPENQPGPSAAPQTVPSRPPNVDPDCNAFSDECCVGSDCPAENDICEQRMCIRNGNPRFSLRWNGDEDLDLYVVTPAGIKITNINVFDAFSGGRFELDPSQGKTGNHVERVYFPVLGAPTGQFKFGVRSLGDRSDTWTVEVYDDDKLVNSQVGQGDSEEFQYLREASQEGPQRPWPSPPRCSPISDECCFDSDCGSDDICVQRTCIADGSPRITLEWTGDDDLNIVVEAPNGVALSERDPKDPVTGGLYQSDGPQEDFGFHVESVYFPKGMADAGSYKFTVESVVTRGVGADVWKVQVFEDGEQVQEQHGIGESRQFTYERLEGLPPPTTPAAPTMPPSSFPVCTRSTDECCVDSHCGPGKICVNRNCVGNGSPRVTLSWTGDDDLDLYLKTPLGDVIFFDRTFDPATGGRFDTEYIQDNFGFHVENMFFPSMSSPLGNYTAGVRLASRRGSADMWTIEILDGGRRQVFETGSGDSEFITYDRKMAVGPSTPGAPSPAPTEHPPVMSPITERPPQGPTPTPPPSDRNCPYDCCFDSDCGMPGDLCVQRTCIKEGTPRFTLTWTGNDDLNLAVITPEGHTISYLHPTDANSGGVFDGHGIQKEFGFHVENIIFPSRGGPDGEYSYFVKSETRRGDSDRWALRVFVDGEIVAWRTGIGSSRTFAYQYGAIIVTPTVQPVIPPYTIPPVATKPPMAVPTSEFCQRDADCQGVGEVCAQGRCINDGNPRFTLVWSGNDDLDLYVETPDGVTISMLNPYDDASGGIFGETGPQNGFDRHVENIYFPQGPSGSYTYYIKNTNPDGSDDFWTVSVSIDGDAKAAQSGSGDSARFVFEFNGGDTGPVVPTQAPDTPACTSDSDCPPNRVCADHSCVPEAFPTMSPGGVCDMKVVECCTGQDCLGDEVCTQNTCIDEGEPRFTLTWTGDDDLDLIVRTPNGTFISFLHNFDPDSGGRFGDGGDQFEIGAHVENIYFPKSDSPVGLYSYFVRSFLPLDQDDTWTVMVYVEGQIVAETSGTGNSEELQYDHVGYLPTLPPMPAPTPPPQNATEAPDDCSIALEECCTDLHCITGVETCVQTQCIDLGNPRFTLTWTGDDDLDLKVETPLGTKLSFIQPVDEATGGIFGEEGSQFEFDKHVENVYFQESKAPMGVYKFSVESFVVRGSNDRWTVTVFVDNQDVASETGFGDSIDFSYRYQGAGSGDAPPQLPACQPDLDECCQDKDCSSDRELCVQRTCIDRGNPRFTLTWTGDDDLDLTVVTPLGSTVAVASPADPLSGGVFGEEGDQLTFGAHVENIYFPQGGGPAGTYTFFVAAFDEIGKPDDWTVTVYVMNSPVLSKSGTGPSEFMVFDYVDGFPVASSDLRSDNLQSVNQYETVPGGSGFGCDLARNKCCQDSDCGAIPNSLCVQHMCINEGSPRFTLTWNGNDDYDLTVTPPIGDPISIEHAVDFESGGRFGEGGLQVEPGLHVENIFFPDGPVGTYTIQVKPNKIIDISDTWAMRVYVGGVEMASFSGAGTASELRFDYRMDNVPSMELEKCSTKTYACCSHDDCTHRNALCLQRSCVVVVPSETTVVLSWLGDDDWDLKVNLTSGDEISYYHPLDEFSGATFAESNDGMAHYERVTLPTTSAGGGASLQLFQWQVAAFNTIGEPDEWQLQIFAGGREVSSRSGNSSAVMRAFEMPVATSNSSGANLAGDAFLHTMEQPELEPTVGITDFDLTLESSPGSCVASSDCTFPVSLCLANQCVDAGGLQVSLQWHGQAEELSVSIWTPDMHKYQSATSSVSEEWQKVDHRRFHLRSLSIPDPLDGKYILSVNDNAGTGQIHDWNLWIHRQGKEVFRQVGNSSGTSFFGYDYES